MVAGRTYGYDLEILMTCLPDIVVDSKIDRACGRNLLRINSTAKRL